MKSKKNELSVNDNYDHLSKEDEKLYGNDSDWSDISDDEFSSMKGLLNKASEIRQISLRLPASDIARCEARAKSQGFKYQSVIKALIHQYGAGKVKLSQ